MTELTLINASGYIFIGIAGLFIICLILMLIGLGSNN